MLFSILITILMSITIPKSLSERIKTMQEDVSNFDKINVLKKRMGEFERINSEMGDCRKVLEGYNELVESVFETGSTDSGDSTEMNDKIYQSEMEEMRNCVQTFQQVEDVEEQIQMYCELLPRISKLSRYLSTREMMVETVNK